MKRMHRGDLYGWSVFDAARDLDFHSLLWVRAGGNIAIDPLPQSAHDREHTERLGGVRYVIVTNSDHLRDAKSLAERFGAQVHGPRGERESLGLQCGRWLGDGEEVVPGLQAFEMAGSKTPGELALLLEDTTLITGDLIRSHEGGRLCLLPEAKLMDPAHAAESVRRLGGMGRIEAVLPGDGWPIFRGGGAALKELVARLQ